jgi:hypothetical protein
MNEKEITISTTKLARFLNFEYSRLDVWLKKNIFHLDNPLPGRGYTRQFNFDDVVVAKVVTDLMRMTGDFGIAKEAVALLHKKPRYWNIYSIVVSFETTLEDNGKFSEKYKVGWGSFAYSKEQKTDYLILDLEEEKTRRSMVLVPVPQIMKSVEEFFNKLKTEVKKES